MVEIVTRMKWPQAEGLLRPLKTGHKKQTLPRASGGNMAPLTP